LNYANQTGTNITISGNNYKTDAITSYHAGIIAEIKLTEGFSVQPELLYSTQGASYKNAVTEFTNELGYIALPIMAKIHLNKAISLELGPQASILLSQKNQFNANDTKSFDFAANGGLVFNITKSLFIDGRYVLGLTNASKEAQIKNSTVQVSLGLLF